MACLLTGERSNFIRFSILFLIFTFFFYKYFSLKKILIIISIVFFMIFSFKDRIIERYTNTLNITYNSKSSIDLVQSYFDTHYGIHALTAYEVLLKKPWFGVGNKKFRYDCHSVKNEIVRKYVQKPIGCATHPHQIWYEFLSEHGFIGTIIITLIILLLIIERLKYKLDKVNFIALSFIIITFIPILPSGSFFTSNNAFLFWINFIFFLINIEKASMKNSD